MIKQKIMSSDKQPLKNSLLSAAATGFSFEESATLLVPVSLDDEPETVHKIREFTPPMQSHPPVSTAAVGPPPSGGNNFRLGNQKRLSYAQYPGLTGSSTSATPSMPPASFFPTGPPVIPQAPLATPLGITNVFTPSMPLDIDNGLVSSPYSVISSPTMTPTFIQTSNSIPPGVPIYPGSTNEQMRKSPSTIHSPPYPGLSSGVFPQKHKHHKNPLMTVFTPLTYHWFYRKDSDARIIWKPFSIIDSTALETAYNDKKEELVPTDGGRYDVDIQNRKKLSVYWEEVACEVRRCSWFYKGPNDSRYIPYDEDLAVRLETEYSQAFDTGIWNRRLEFPGGEAITLHNPIGMAHFCKAAAPDEWGNVPENHLRPRVVKRGVEQIELEEGESTQIDHLVFLVHGIGAICDFKFRSIVEAVDDFRHISFQLMNSHFKDAVETKQAGRVEFLPISWHKALHGEGGIDHKLKQITLKSIPKLRNFTNDTLLDILFYTSPIFAQTIVDTVGMELNRLFNLFLQRNPDFNGYVALSGHSLGSLILFDLLAHQPKMQLQKSKIKKDRNSPSSELDKAEANTSLTSVESTESSSRMVSFTIGSGTGQPLIKYPVLEFEPTAFFALGSPIAMFVTVRGIDILGEEFHFPTCPAFFNIFHPYDPVAYRIETLVDPTFDSRPVLISHHKGRKRFHLELKETMQRVGSDIRQKVVDSIKTTWNTIAQYAFAKPEHLEEEVDRVIEGELNKKAEDVASSASSENGDPDIGLGKLNGGRRIDYVLQEAPLESFNEYLFALTSHVCYWESEDTILLILKEIYASMGVYEEKKLAPEVSTTSEDFPSTSSPYVLPIYQPQSPDSSISTPMYTVEPTTSFMEPPPLYPAPSYSSAVSSSDPSNLTFNPGSSNGNNRRSSSIKSALSEDQKKPIIIGARPVVSPDALAALRGMDPTAPITTGSTVGPPPMTGFIRKN